jgi:hypothetical protein
MKENPKTKDPSENSLSRLHYTAFSRRRILRLGGAAALGAGLLLLESKLPRFDTQAFMEPFGTPTPPLTNKKRFVLGVPGVVRTEQKKVPVAADLVHLKDRLAAEIDNYQGQTAICVADVKSGETIDVNGDRLQLTGCVANLFCALAVIAQESLGRIPREEVEYELTTMVRHSNPHVGDGLVYRLGNDSYEVGVKMINYMMKLWGMEKSIYSNPPAYSSYCFEGCRRPNEATANEINMILTKLARNELYPQSPDFDWNHYAFWVMCDNKPGLNFMIPGEIPESEAIVAHKVGWYPGYPHTINDVGIVVARNNRFSFAISYLYQNFDYSISEPALYAGPGYFLKRLAGLSYETFLSRYK